MTQNHTSYHTLVYFSLYIALLLQSSFTYRYDKCMLLSKKWGELFNGPVMFVTLTFLLVEPN